MDKRSHGPIRYDGDKVFFGSLRVRRPDPITKIFMKTTITDDCWLYNGSTGKDGYARFRYDGKYKVVHRFIYETFYGPLKKEQLCCHKCDVRNCINPAHIFIGSSKDNLQDMVKKGRSLTGEKNHKCRIKEDDINKIIEMRKNKETLESIGKKFEVTKHAIYSILNGRTWKHLKKGIING